MPAQKMWTEDWETFVKSVGEHFGRGLGGSAVTEQFAGERVVWSGKVLEKRFDIDYPGVQMEMPPIHIEWPDGRSAKVDFLFLTLRKGELQSWHDVEVGETLRFATKIRRSNGPFSGIRWCDLDDKRGVILFSTDGAFLYLQRRNGIVGSCWRWSRLPCAHGKMRSAAQ